MQSKSMKTFDISMRAGAPGVADMDVYGVIGQGWFSDVNAKDFRRELSALGNVTQINVHIHSPGGSPIEAFAIYNTLKAHPAVVHTYSDGVVASAATIIFLAGETRHIAKNAWVMIHDLTAGVEGTLKRIRAQLDMIARHEQQIVDLYVENTSVGDEAAVRETMEAETWYNAEDAIEFGFADVVDDDVKLDSAALCMSIKHFNNTPMVLMGAVKDPGAAAADKPEIEDESMEEITLEAVRQHPEIVDALHAEVDVAAPVLAERSRIKDILSLNADFPSLASEVQELALDGKTTKADAVLVLLAKMRAKGLAAFADRSEDANRNSVILPDGSTPDASLEGLSAEDKAAKMWETNMVFEGVKVRDEFGNVEQLAAYIKGAGQGRVKMLKRKEGGE